MWKPVSQDGENEILPPLCKKGVGGPKNKRIPSRGEKQKEIRCSRCKNVATTTKKHVKKRLQEFNEGMVFMRLLLI